MKYLKIHLPQEPGKKMQYPDQYRAEIEPYIVDNSTHLYINDPAVNNDCFLLLIVSDECAYKGDNVTYLTKAEMKVFSTPFEKKEERITNEAVLRRLEIKVKDGGSLTADEQKALDPADPTPGIEFNETFSDKIDKL